MSAVDEVEQSSLPVVPPAPVINSSVQVSASCQSPADVEAVCSPETASAMISAHHRHGNTAADLQVFDALLSESSSMAVSQNSSEVTDSVRKPQHTLSVMYDNTAGLSPSLGSGHMLPSVATPVLTFQNMNTHNFEYHNQSTSTVMTTQPLSIAANLLGSHITASSIPVSQVQQPQHTATPAVAIQPAGATDQQQLSHPNNVLQNINQHSLGMLQHPAALQNLNQQTLHHLNQSVGMPPAVNPLNSNHQSSNTICSFSIPNSSFNMMANHTMYSPASGGTGLLHNSVMNPPLIPSLLQPLNLPTKPSHQTSPNMVSSSVRQPLSAQNFQIQTSLDTSAATEVDESGVSQAWLSHKGASILCQSSPVSEKSLTLSSKLNAQKKRFHTANLKTVGKGKKSKMHTRSEFRANTFRSTLLKKSPRVDFAAHNTAFQSVQNMLLLDESKRIAERFSYFCTDLEEKMKSNPKLFVPAVRNLMNTWEDLKDDLAKAAALKDFGKLEVVVLEEHRRKQLENNRDRSVQVTSSQTSKNYPTVLTAVEKVQPGQQPVFFLPAANTTELENDMNSDRAILLRDLTLVPADVKLTCKEKSALLKSLKASSSPDHKRPKQQSVEDGASRKMSKRKKMTKIKSISEVSSNILKRLQVPPKPVSEVRKRLEAAEIEKSKSSPSVLPPGAKRRKYSRVSRVIKGDFCNVEVDNLTSEKTDNETSSTFVQSKSNNISSGPRSDDSGGMKDASGNIALDSMPFDFVDNIDERVFLELDVKKKL